MRLLAKEFSPLCNVYTGDEYDFHLILVMKIAVPERPRCCNHGAHLG